MTRTSRHASTPNPAHSTDSEFDILTSAEKIKASIMFLNNIQSLGFYL